jgi:hypothetical protein
MKTLFLFALLYSCVIKLIAQEFDNSKEIYDLMNQNLWVYQGKKTVYCQAITVFDSAMYNSITASKSYKNGLIQDSDITFMASQFSYYHSNKQQWVKEKIKNKEIKIIKNLCFLTKVRQWFVYYYSIPVFTRIGNIAFVTYYRGGQQYLLYKKENDKWFLLEDLGGTIASP